MSHIKNFLQNYPAILLLFFVYLFFIPKALSYHHAWMLPEEFLSKKVVLADGGALQWKDLKTGLDWEHFERAPRNTRPLSSYFEILDTKFRCWLWQYILPHPSVSLTWLFSLFLAPLFLYRLLRYWGGSVNTAISMTAFYLMTPAVMSYSSMLFRPGKPMANFFIIFCLYQACRLQERFLNQQQKIPVMNYLIFWSTAAFSFYWDETSWLIFPAMILFFPKVITSSKRYLGLWLMLPLVTLLFYFKIIPMMTLWAGFNPSNLLGYDMLHKGISLDLFFHSLMFNAKNLILQTVGILVPDILRASIWIKTFFVATVLSWSMICFYVLKAWSWPKKMLMFLGFLVLFFNYSMMITAGVWGPYYYGAYWSIFFVLWLGSVIEKSNIKKAVLTICLFFVFLSMSQGFLAINDVYKRNHYYPYTPLHLVDYFNGKESFFDQNQQPQFSGDDIKWYVNAYWLASKQKPPLALMSALPRELYWLVIELHPDRYHAKYELSSQNVLIPTLILDKPLQ